MNTNNNQNISIVNQTNTQQNQQNTNSKPSPGQQNGSSESKGTGNTIGHYQLGKALGEGTFGKVKLGTHILTEEKVAVKVLEKSRIKDKKDVERISREIKILKQLHHPNVVQIYEIIETEKDLYLVMEFVECGELFDLIVENKRLKEQMACKYFQELISGINYIHQLGICHRDLKPENLLIDYDQSLKIVDFGLSNLYEQGNTLSTACGSPCYAAPEMIAGNRYNGLMSDLWSCGVVLYAMLCGYLPYEDKKTSDLYKKILHAEYTLPDFLSEEAKDMISQIFITDPNKRITVEEIRAHPWYQIHKPETAGFNVYPPIIQEKRSNMLQKNNKTYQMIQRPNLLNQKIIQKLETAYNFNRESLLKSIRNNKHNHLTATYYLLLKKHMVRHGKPYTEAFLELKQIDDPKQLQIANNPSSEFKQNQQRMGQGQQPKIHLKSQAVQEAIKVKRQENKSETPVPDGNIQTQDYINDGVQLVQKQFQSIDPNNFIDVTNQSRQGQRGSNVDSQKIRSSKQNQTKPINNSDYQDHINQSQQQQDGQFQGSQNQYRKQYDRNQQNSRQSNNSKKSNRDQGQRTKYTVKQGEKGDQMKGNQMPQSPDDQDFTQQTQQSFTKKTNQQHQNAFNRRRECSANPYINAGSTNYQPSNKLMKFDGNKNDNLKQYQHQINQLKQQEMQQQQLNQQLQKSGRSPRWQSNDNQDLSSDRYNQSNKSYKQNQGNAGYQNNYSKQNRQKSQKSQDSFRNNNDENNSNNNQGPNNKLINPYQMKRRAESYNNRRGDNSGSLDKFNILIDDGNQRKNEDEEVQYIRSKNMKEQSKGDRREIRAPSSGSSGSQPRVQACGQSNTGSGQLSMNSSGVQRRYDSIEHQRQSQIDKFMLSPQEQVDQYVKQNRNMKNNQDMNQNKNLHKKIKIINPQGHFTHNNQLDTQAQNIRNFNTNSVHSYNNNHQQPRGPDNNNINIVNVINIKNKQGSDPSSQQHKSRGASKSQNITNVNEAAQQQRGDGSHNRNGNQYPSQQQSSNQGSQGQGSHGQTQNYYKHLQEQLNRLHQRRQNTAEGGIQQLNQQYSSNLKNMQQAQQDQMIISNLHNMHNSANMNNTSYQDIDENDGMEASASQNNVMGNNMKMNQNGQQNYGTVQNTLKNNHRKAKSMLNRDAVGANGAYQNQKVQQVKLTDGGYRNLMHQLAQNKSNVSNNSNGNSNSIISIQNSNKVNVKKEQLLNNQGGTGANNHNFVMHGSGNHAPTMPSAPKSGNIIKLKPQVVRTKSSNQRERGSSQNQQNQQSSIHQQPLTGNGPSKKKTIVHTTKNTMGQGHQHNFNMIDPSNADINVNHIFSVQHPQNTSSKENQRGIHNPNDPITDNSIATSVANKSGATLKSNYSKITQGKQSYTNNSQTEGYLQNLLREFEKNQHNQSGKISQNNVSQQQQLQQAIRQINQNEMNAKSVQNGNGSIGGKSSINSNTGNTNQGQGSINVTSISNSIKRSKVKVHQKQKTHQIENIQKQISQNQKTMQNMTQNLFSKNNTGQFMPQQNQRGQQQIDIYEEQKAQNLNDSVRGSSRGMGSQKMASSGGQNQSSQNQNQRRQSNHQNPNHQRGMSGGSQGQNQNNGGVRHSSHQKNNNMQNDPHNYRNHYQTQDNRRGQDPNTHQNATLQNQMHIKQQPSSTTAAMSGNGGLQSRHSQHSGNFMPQNETTNSAMSAGMNMEELMGQQMQNQKGEQQNNGQAHSRKASQNNHQRANSKGSKNGGYNNRGSSSGNSQNVQMKQNFSGNNGNNGIQMSFMSKYNQQQQQLQMQNQQQRDQQRNMTGQQHGNGSNGQGGSHTRHYSAPREGAYGQPIGIDDDELKRQHLLNQSVDMSQFNNNLHAQINKMGGYNKMDGEFYHELQKLNLSQFGNSVSNIGNNVRSVQNQRNSVEMTHQMNSNYMTTGTMGQNQNKMSQKVAKNQAYDNQHQNFTPNQMGSRQSYQGNFDFGSTQYNVNSSSAGMTGTASIPGMGGMRADVSGGLNLAQDYSHGHGLDGAMDRSSRGTAATAANTISGNINRSGGNINYRPAVGTASGSSGEGSQNIYSQQHFQASQAYYEQQMQYQMNDTNSGDIGRHGSLHNNDI